MTDSLIAASKIEPMTIVCPRMDNSRGLNSAKIARQEKIGNNVIDVGRYEDYFIQEIIPYIDGNFNTIASRKGRYVGGCSAGGFAAIHYGLKYPELFSRIGGHMPAIETELALSDIPYYGNEHSFHKTILWSSSDLKSYIKSKSGFLMQGMKMRVVSTMRWNHCPRN